MLRGITKVKRHSRSGATAACHDGRVIIDGAWYVNGERTLDTDSIDDLAAERHKGGSRSGFAWLGLRMPTDDELSDVAKTFDIPELAIADARHKHDRPKVERHDSCLLTVVPTARYVDTREEVEFGNLFLYAGQDYIVTVRYGQAAPLQGVRTDLERTPDIMRHGPGAVLQAALLHVVESYGPVMDGLENDVREVERDVFSESRGQPTRRIYFLIREVLDFLIALEPLSPALRRLTGRECHPWVHEEVIPLFHDVEEALLTVVERGRTAHQLLNNVLAVSTTQTAMQQNADMRRISAWAAIGVVPTVIAGLFGMNLGGIPGGHSIMGFTLVTGLCLLVCVVLYRRLKGANWL
jgi:magnesium transporter